MTEFKFGAIPSPVDPRDYSMPSGTSGDNFPSAYSSLKGLNYKVKNQGQVNSCVSFALATAMELNAKSVVDRRSNGFIYHNRDDMEYKGEGMYTRDALKSAQKVGCCLWNDYKENIEVPEGYKVFNELKSELIPKANKCKIGNYYYINIKENPKYLNTPLGMLDEKATKRAIIDNGFVIVCFFVFPSINKVDKSDPILDYPDLANEEILGSHAVIITGWTDDGLWEVVNSWGEGFGANGIFYVPLDFPFHEAWTFSNLITETPADNKGWYKKDGKWHYCKNGEEIVGWYRINDKWYYFNSDGVMATGWLKYKNDWYYLNKNGDMATGWMKHDNRWYYFVADGRAVKGFNTIEDKVYYFAELPVGNIKECQLIITDDNGKIL